MEPLRAGALRRRLTVRRATENATGKGGYTTAWRPFATVHAEVMAFDGREVVLDQALQGISVYRIRIRWRDDLTTEDQLSGSCFGLDAEGNPRNVNIRSIADPDGRRKQLVIMADTASTRSS